MLNLKEPRGGAAHLIASLQFSFIHAFFQIGEGTIQFVTLELWLDDLPTCKLKYYHLSNLIYPLFHCIVDLIISLLIMTKE